jgi:hypothetical protein
MLNVNQFAVHGLLYQGIIPSSLSYYPIDLGGSGLGMFNFFVGIILAIPRLRPSNTPKK